MATVVLIRVSESSVFNPLFFLTFVYDSSAALSYLMLSCLADLHLTDSYQFLLSAPLQIRTFTGIDVQNFTGGVYDAQTLTQGDNFACLAYEFAAQEKPDVLLNSFTELENAIGSVSSKLECKQLKNFDYNQLNQFPGYKRSQG